MTLTKDITAKFAVAAVAVAMIFSAFAPAAQAQTTEDLQQMINDLLAQVAGLQSQLGGGESETTGENAGICPYTWTRDLSIGSEGADVMKLQQFLNSNPDLRVAASGAGSIGAETTYYGPATAAAVSKMQVMYRSEVLTPGGLVNPTGYFGPSTRAKANALCVAAPVDGGDMDDEDGTEDEDEEDDSSDMTLGGEASLDSFDIADGNDDEVDEGQSDAVVAEITMEFEDGDAEISRLDVKIDGGSANNPDAFDTISLWVDGDMVAEMDADDEDDYRDDEMTMRFSGLDIVAMEDEELEILVAVSAQNNVDIAEQTTYTVTVESMRFFDADGVAVTATPGTETLLAGEEATFTVQEAGTGESLDISRASNNPDATDIVVDTDNNTDDVTIMIADLEAQENDLEVNKMVVLVETAGASTTDVVDEIRLVIDGQSFDAENIVGSGAPTGNDSTYVNAVTQDAVWYVFDIDGDLVLDEDDEVSMEVVVDFNDTNDGARYANGTTIRASVTGTEAGLWEAEGADDLDPADFDGSSVGDLHVLVAEGILVPVDGFTADEQTLGQDDNIGEFTLEFEVSAVEGDFYITDLATTSDEDNGVRFSVDNAADAVINGILTSTADEDGVTGAFIVREGETETFTLTVTLSQQGSVITPRVTLTEINYTDETDGIVDGGAGVIEGTYLPTPASDFRSDVQTVQI